MPKQPSKRPPRVFRNHDLEGLTDQLAANQVAAVHWLLFRKNLNPFHPKTARANLYNRAYLEVQRLLPKNVRQTIDQLQIDAIDYIYDVAQHHENPAVLILGDILDHPKATPTAADYLLQRHLSKPFAPTFLLPGNHDPWPQTTFYDRPEWPPHIHFLSSPEPYPTPLAHPYAPDTAYLWSSCPPPTYTPRLEPLRLNIPARYHDQTNVLVTHGTYTTDDPPPADAINPLVPSRIDPAGLALTLAGHKHRPTIHYPENSTPVAYPGSPWPLNAYDDHPRSLLLAQAHKKNVRLSSTQMPFLNAQTDAILLHGTDWPKRLELILQDHQPHRARRTILNLTLLGRPHPETTITARRIIDANESRWLHVTTNNRLLPPDTTDILNQLGKHQKDYLQALDQLIENEPQGEWREILEMTRLTAYYHLHQRQSHHH